MHPMAQGPDDDAPDAENQQKANDAPPSLFDSNPNGVAAAAAAGAGIIALGTIGVEILTDRWLARTLDLGIGFVSLPMGLTASLVGGLVCRLDLRSALPALTLAAVYWALFATYI